MIAGLGFGVVDRVKEWSKPRVETVSGFLDAVRDIDNADFAKAEPLLRKYAAEYPDSFLPKLYLSFALDGWKKPAEIGHNTKISPEVFSGKRELNADELFRQALKLPDVRRSLIAWGQHHPKLALQLEAFAKARFDRAERRSRDKNYDTTTLAADRKVLFKEAQPALEIAAVLDPKSLRVPRLLAIIEENDGQYQAAFERISPSIDAGKVRGPDQKELFASNIVRGRIATQWAGELRSDPQTIGKALKLMQQAVEDLRKSEEYVTTHHNDNFRRFYVLGNKAPAFLTLSEIETDLGMIREATEHFQIALETFDEIGQDLKTTILPEHFPNLPVFKERAAKLEQRLEVNKGGPRVQPDPDTSRPAPAASSPAPHEP